MTPRIGFHGLGMRDDPCLKFAVIAARYGDKWIWCMHRRRDTWEIPGGHIEPGERALDCANRELYEETGATEYKLEPVSVYSVDHGGGPSFWLLCLARVHALGPLPPLEIKRIELFDRLPQALTYPDIQPALLLRAAEMLLVIDE